MLHVASAADARVVDQHVQSAEPLHRGGDCVIPLGLAGNVQADEYSLTADFPDLSGDPPSFLLQNVADCDHRPFPGEHPGLGCAHASRSTADESDLSFQSHASLRSSYSLAL